MGVLNANEAALLIAILYKQYVTPEQAFRLYDTGKVGASRGKTLERVKEMQQHRSNGLTWSDIAGMMGLKSASSAVTYYEHKKYLLEGSE